MPHKMTDAEIALADQYNGKSARIDTTTQQIKNCVVAALTECGLVEQSPLGMTERQGIAIRTVLATGRNAVNVLYANCDPKMVVAGEGPRIANQLEAVLAELAKEFGL